MTDHTKTTLEECWQKHVECVCNGIPSETGYRDFMAGIIAALGLLDPMRSHSFSVMYGKRFDALYLEAVSAIFKHPDRYSGNPQMPPCPWETIEGYRSLMARAARGDFDGTIKEEEKGKPATF